MCDNEPRQVGDARDYDLKAVGESYQGKNSIPQNKSSVGVLSNIEKLNNFINTTQKEVEMRQKEVSQRVEFYARLDYNELCAHIKKLHVSVQRETFDLNCANEALSKKLGL